MSSATVRDYRRAWDVLAHLDGAGTSRLRKALETGDACEIVTATLAAELELKAGYDPNEPRDPHTGEWMDDGGGSFASRVVDRGRIIPAERLPGDVRSALRMWEGTEKPLESHYGVVRIPRSEAIDIMKRIVGPDWQHYAGREAALAIRPEEDWPIIVDPAYHDEVADGIHRLYRQLMAGAEWIRVVYPAGTTR